MSSSEAADGAPHLGSGQVQPLTRTDAKQLAIHTETLQTFKDKVDGLLHTLESSGASHKHMSEQDVSADSYGEGFGEASDLMSAYNKVHGNLKTLSQTLRDQIEAMSITSDLIRKDFTNVDEDQASRLHALQRRMAKNADKSKHQHAPGGEKSEDRGTGGTGGM
jgi:hypothetical protein